MKKAMTGLILLLLLGAALARTQRPRTAQDYFQRGLDRHERGDPDGAIADYDRTLELDSRSAEIFYNRGLARYEQIEMAPLGLLEKVHPGLKWADLNAQTNAARRQVRTELLNLGDHV